MRRRDCLDIRRPCQASLERHRVVISVITSPREEFARISILKPQPAREARVLRAGTDVNALRRVEMVPLNEQHGQAGQRLPAPAHRRPRGVWTVLDLDVHSEQLLHPGKDCGHIGRGHLLFRDLRLPGQREQQPSD